MAQLKYEPKGLNPQGKQKVYFCAHSQDYKLFDEISKAILQRQNCVVWYDEQPNEQYDSDSWLNNLSEMQLFVMPITTKLLTTPNRALDVELKYALEHHIPVLPLMYESGLEELYATKFGDLQFLDRYNQDTTAISYEDKLTKYLNSVLVNDQLAEKVRSEFDAYIFLSYRKKDRAKAQELMRLIHKNDFCRDVAIWYDEFLVPGEQFNQAIQKALHSSQLFALAVTPNLLEKDNYIMNNEYPLAKQVNKKILPVELKKTNKKVLKQYYNEIPNTVNAYNNELTDSLLDYFKDIAIKDNDNNPQHNYFIGLAYLKGIDVEVDHERALELITYSAQHEMPEAMQTLCDMYNTGEGVTRDYMTVISWRQKLVEYYERQYKATPDKDTFVNLISAIDALGNDYRAVGKLTEALSIYQKGFKIAQRADVGDINIKLIAQASLLRSLGDMWRANSNLQETENCYSQALEIAKQLCVDTGTVSSHRDLSICYSKLGVVYKAKGNLQEAEKSFKKALHIDKQLYEKTGTAESCKDLSVSYSNLGDVYKAKGNLQDAEQYYTKALKIDKQLYDEIGTAESYRDLSISYNNLGKICQAKDNLQEAEEFYKQSLEIDKQLYEETGTVQSYRDLAISYSKLGDVSQSKRNLQVAEEYYKQSLNIRKQLYEKTGTVESCRDLSVIFNRLGDVFQLSDNLQGAEEYYRQSLDIDKQLYEATGTVESCRDLAISYSKLGDVCQANGNLNEAEEYFKQALEINNQLYEDTGTVESYKDLSVIYKRLGDVCQEKGNLQKSMDYFKQALTIDKQLFEATGTVESCRDLTISYNMLSEICKASGNLQQAEEYYKKAFEIFKQLYEQTH